MSLVVPIFTVYAPLSMIVARLLTILKLQGNEKRLLFNQKLVSYASLYALCAVNNLIVVYTKKRETFICRRLTVVYMVSSAPLSANVWNTYTHIVWHMVHFITIFVTSENYWRVNEKEKNSQPNSKCLVKFYRIGYSWLPIHWLSAELWHHNMDCGRAAEARDTKNTFPMKLWSRRNTNSATNIIWNGSNRHPFHFRVHWGPAIVRQRSKWTKLPFPKCMNSRPNWKSKFATVAQFNFLYSQLSPHHQFRSCSPQCRWGCSTIVLIGISEAGRRLQL